MERLKKVGDVKARNSSEIKNSPIGLGFEKLDRGLFDPEKAYDKVAKLGVKWIRIQSGWARTEKVPGVYEWEWLDSIIDNLIRRRPGKCSERSAARRSRPKRSGTHGTGMSRP